MNTPLLLVLLALAAPSAQAAPHSVVIRATNGAKVFSHTSQVESGKQDSWDGTVGGRRMIVNLVLREDGDATNIEYQLEVSEEKTGSSFQAQSSFAMKPGYGLRTIDCGGWKIDVALDAAMPANAVPSSAPSGSSLRTTASFGGRVCKVVSGNGVQSNVVGRESKSAASGFILNTMLARDAAHGTAEIQYQLENGRQQDQGDVTAKLGKKTAAKGGKISFLVEAGR